MSAPNIWISFLKAGGALLLVLGLLLLTLYLMRRFSMGRLSGGHPSDIQILSTKFVSPKERVVLVEVEGQKILLGVTSQQINTLAEIRPPDPDFEDVMFSVTAAAPENAKGDPPI